jgi:hypothetical protein
MEVGFFCHAERATNVCQKQKKAKADLEEIARSQIDDLTGKETTYAKKLTHRHRP